MKQIGLMGQIGLFGQIGVVGQMDLFGQIGAMQAAQLAELVLQMAFTRQKLRITWLCGIREQALRLPTSLHWDSG